MYVRPQHRWKVAGHLSQHVPEPPPPTVVTLNFEITAPTFALRCSTPETSKCLLTKKPSPRGCNETSPLFPDMTNGEVIPSTGMYDLKVKFGDVPVTARHAILPNLTIATVLGMDFQRYPLKRHHRCARCFECHHRDTSRSPSTQCLVEGSSNTCRPVQQPIPASRYHHNRPGLNFLQAYIAGQT